MPEGEFLFRGKRYNARRTRNPLNREREFENFGQNGRFNHARRDSSLGMDREIREG